MEYTCALSMKGCSCWSALVKYGYEIHYLVRLAPVAQWIELVGSNDKVGGSNPSRGTKESSLWGVFLFSFLQDIHIRIKLICFGICNSF